MTEDATKTLVHGLVLSRVDYTNSLLCSAPDYLFSRLQRVQNQAARIIMRIPKYDHISPALMSMHWLPIAHRVHFKVLLLVYKILNGSAPDYLSSLLETRTHSRTLRSSNTQLLEVTRTKTVTYGSKCFTSVASVLWNNLPIHVKKSATVTAVKKSLKTHLFKAAYNV